MRRKEADLGKENIGIAAGILGAQVAYDLYEALTDKGTFWQVLSGDKFYEKPEKKITLGMEADPDSIGFFVSKRF